MNEPTERIPTETGPTRQIPVEEPAPTTEPIWAPTAAAPVEETEQLDPVPPVAPMAPVPPRPTGPHAPAIILGLVALAVAGIVLAQELGNLTVDWGDVGPLGFVAVGAVLVVLGAVGLLGSNRRSTRP